ncbi:hypothetical protein [Nostoc commune]|uniref:hypothetical protein n=1 Tax=Nostoc commune TaxID=1178 RepID=UPI001E3F73E7|nr:hypothetical protein [Nostoc commune]
MRHPAVAEALAFAVPQKSLAYCSTMLADFKVPKQIHILDQLPRGATGKLQRLAMAKLLNIA